jgi:hypothetical protein
MTNILISLAAEFTGIKAFKDADRASAKLNSSMKKLAGSFGLAFGTAAVVQFSKKAVSAFAEDEAAATRLTRAVENLGIGFANPAISEYISKLEKSASIADDILRPSFQALLTTTGSLTQSQKLLTDAITISRASGVDLATVTDDLGKGYIGITKGLTKYNTGLSKAELQSKSFSEILGIILKRSAGAAEDYLDTTAFKFDVLSVASNNASEIIGGSLVDAFALIGGGTDATDAAYAIETIATALGKVTVAGGRTIGVIPTLIKNLKNLPNQIFAGFAGKQFGVNIVPPTKKAEAKLTLTEKKQQELLAKLEKESLAREKERLKLKDKQAAAAKLALAIAKAETALGKGQDIFDDKAITLNAAMINQAKQLGMTQDAAAAAMIIADMQRIKIKQDMIVLEDAIASKDTARIEAATKQLNADIGILGALTGQNNKLIDIKSVLDGFKKVDLINLDNLTQALALLAQFKFPTLTVAGSGKTTGGGTTGGGAPFGGESGFTPEPFNPPISGNGAPFGGESGFTPYPNVLGKGPFGGESGFTSTSAVLGSSMSAQTMLENIVQDSLTQVVTGGNSFASLLAAAAAQNAASMNNTVKVQIVDRTSGLIEVVQNAVIENSRYGNNLDYAGAI